MDRCQSQGVFGLLKGRITVEESLTLFHGREARSRRDEAEIVQQYQVNRTYKDFYTGWSVTIDPRNLVYTYDPKAQRFLFRNLVDGTSFVLTVSGAKVHAGRVVTGWGHAVFVTAGVPEPGEHRILNEKGEPIQTPVRVFISTYTPAFTPQKRLAITYTLRLAAKGEDLPAAWRTPDAVPPERR